MQFNNLVKGFIVAGALFAGAAQAAFVPLPAGPVTLEDDNLEYVLSPTGTNGAYEIKTSGDLAVGDRLRAMISFQTVGGTSTQAPGLEVTGISEIEIASVEFPSGPDFPLITFKPSEAFEAEYGTGAMAALYSQAAGDFPLTTELCSEMGVPGCEEVATNGELWMVAGLSDADDYWTSTSFGLDGISIDRVKAALASQPIGIATYALTILENNTGYEFAQQELTGSFIKATSPEDNLVDLIGSGTLLGGAGLDSPFFARSDFDFNLLRTVDVPEPATLAIFSLGLLGLGFRARSSAK